MRLKALSRHTPKNQQNTKSHQENPYPGSPNFGQIHQKSDSVLHRLPGRGQIDPGVGVFFFAIRPGPASAMRRIRCGTRQAPPRIKEADVDGLLRGCVSPARRTVAWDPRHNRHT
jgi:hypothetical protein